MGLRVRSHPNDLSSANQEERKSDGSSPLVAAIRAPRHGPVELEHGQAGHDLGCGKAGMPAEFVEGKDLVPAYAWFNIAQANGYEDAKERRDELELTPEQVAKAQALSTEIQKRIEADRKD